MVYESSLHTDRPDYNLHFSTSFRIFVSFLTSFLRFRLFVLKTEKNLGWRDERMLKKEEMTSFSGNHFSWISLIPLNGRKKSFLKSCSQTSTFLTVLHLRPYCNRWNGRVRGWVGRQYTEGLSLKKKLKRMFICQCRAIIARPLL